MTSKIFLILILFANLAMCQSERVTDEIILMNIKTINLAIFEHNTARFKVIDNEYHDIKYNSDGNPILVLAKNGSEKKVFRYDQVGRLTKLSYNGTEFYYSYDSVGRFEKMYIDDTLTPYEQYRYNSQNQIVEHKRKNKDGVLCPYQTYNFDMKGQLILYKLYLIDYKAIYQVDSLEYDKNSRLATRICKYYSNDGRVRFTSTIKSTYDQIGNKTEDNVWHDDELIVSEVHSYDSSNKLIKSVKSDVVLQSGVACIFSYKNNKVSRIRTLRHELKNNVETLISDTYVDYEFDSFGNQIAIIYRNSKLEEEDRSTLKFLEIKR